MSRHRLPDPQAVTVVLPSLAPDVVDNVLRMLAEAIVDAELADSCTDLLGGPTVTPASVEDCEEVA
jgi:hypothetical protein